MTDRELMQQALDALELLAWYENPATKVQVRKPRNGGPIVTMYPHKVATEAAAPLRERLAQPEQEPVSHVYFLDYPSGRPRVAWDNANNIKIGDKLYTTPPQRKPLTHPQIHELDWPDGVSFEDILPFVRSIEAAHGIKEKNA